MMLFGMFGDYFFKVSLVWIDVEVFGVKCIDDGLNFGLRNVGMIEWNNVYVDDLVDLRV